ncbi:aminotransferase class III-fold pyridoxal phosphate-dependent enzyme [Candidatus Peregrinibacteria bacterium]|nr:aminotransferase class III-fold pyridoxal phosphate-dependent enzyme [Candidatus Peregrinibacteria bacterium]
MSGSAREIVQFARDADSLSEGMSPEEVASAHDAVSVGGLVYPWGCQYPPRAVPEWREGFRVGLRGQDPESVLDAHQCILSMSEGWGNPRIEAAIRHFRERYQGVDMVDTSQLSPQAILLLKELKDLLNPYGDFRGLLASSGSLANNQAIALCMASLGGEERTQMVAMEGGYGGRDLATNAMLCTAPGWTGDTTLQSLAAKAIRVNRDGSNLDQALEQMRKAYTEGRSPLWHTEDGIQGVGGFHVYPPELMRALAEEVTRLHGKKIYDEVQTFVRNSAGPLGMDLWGDRNNPAHRPDAVTFAKGLGNGHGIGATMVSEDTLRAVAAGRKPGNTFDTFSQPLDGIVAARMVLRMVLEKEQWKNVAARSARFKRQTADFQKRYPDVVAEVVGTGGMVGLRLTSPAMAIRALTLAPQKGVIFAKGGKGDILRTSLPFSVTDAFVDELCGCLADVMQELQQASEKSA